MKEGWTYKKLGEVCEILDSQRKPITKNKRESGSIPYYGATGCLDYVKDYIFDEKLVLLGEDGAKWDAGENSAYIIEGKSWVNNHAHALRPKRDIILDEILVYYLNFANLQPFITGVTVPKLNQEKMRSIDIPIYPISEQQRIVSRLDSAFAHIDERKANAEKQLSEARALFQKALTKAMEPKEGWEEKKMKEIVVSLTDGDHQPPPKSNDGIPFITISNIDKDANRIDFENTFFVPRSYFEGLKKDRIPHEGDVLYTVTGSFGIPVLIDFQKEFCFQRHIALIRPNQNRLSSKFLYYWILSSYATTQAEDTATGTAQRTVSLNSLRNFVITIPPLSEQQRIVSRLDSLSAHVRELEEVLQKTIAECDALKQALLRKVFE